MVMRTRAGYARHSLPASVDSERDMEVGTKETHGLRG
jgi:hypothetical protein